MFDTHRRKNEKRVSQAEMNNDSLNCSLRSTQTRTSILALVGLDFIHSYRPDMNLYHRSPCLPQTAKVETARDQASTAGE